MKTPECIFYLGRFSKLWDEECIAQSFESLGVKVIRQEERERVENIIKHIEETKPDLILMAKLNVIGDGNLILKRAKELNIPTASWTFDLYFDYPRESQVPHLPFFKADYVFTTDGGHQDKFKKLGINHICLRQGVFEPEAILMDAPKTKDVVFVGSQNPSHPYRQTLMKSLGDKYGDNFHWIGRKDTDAVRSLNLNKLFAESKVVIGDSVYSPQYWSNRIYESLGRGAFLISPAVPGLEKEFEYYKHFVPYTIGDLPSIHRKIDYYLEHDTEREKIRNEGFAFTKKHYTYQKRCEKFLQLLTGTKGSKKPQT